jgi:hypothetical protein
MRSLFSCAVAAALVATPAAAQTSQVFVIEFTSGAFLSNGGCSATFTLTNNYNMTVAVSAKAVISDSERTSLGESSLSFPPAVPGGRSIATAHFYNFNVAGGRCPTNYVITVSPWFCPLTGTGRQLADVRCLGTKEWTIGAVPLN